ncbi:MAG TPA: hypothetical protein DC057_04305 [Spirochaetia bacterium]|nr:hypothetical protein [Spirochaetia bacterium]
MKLNHGIWNLKMNLIVDIKMNLHKLIESIKNYKKTERKRRDLDSIRANEEMAHISKSIMDNKYFGKHFKKKADIIRKNKEE